jgi:rhodanese-related sulfurtransferase
VALRLIGNGFTKVSVLKGGWDAWVQAGYPTVPK